MVQIIVALTWCKALDSNRRYTGQTGSRLSVSASQSNECERWSAGRGGILVVAIAHPPKHLSTANDVVGPQRVAGAESPSLGAVDSTGVLVTIQKTHSVS